MNLDGSLPDNLVEQPEKEAANNPVKSIQLAMESVPPSSVLRFLTTF